MDARLADIAIYKVKYLVTDAVLVVDVHKSRNGGTR
jgi:hypothetical protein